MGESVNLVVLQGQLSLLANFLDRVSTEAGQELEAVDERNADGAFDSLESYQDALDYPLARLDIAARALAYELVALVESELHQLAHQPWLESPTHKGPKNLLELADTGTTAKLRTVSDLAFGEIVALVESRLSLSLRSLEGWNHIEELREIVNALKHRCGYKRLREVDRNRPLSALSQRYQFTYAEARKAIGDVGTFFRQLKRAVREASSSDLEHGSLLEKGGGPDEHAD
jgi:hypothetical protein